MKKVTIRRTALANLLGYVHTILDLVDTESLSEENVDKVADGYVDFVEPIMKVVENTFECPHGGDETDDCADCPYSGDYHFVNGECVRREEE